MALADLSVSRKLTVAFATALLALLCMCAATVALQGASTRAARENAASYKVVAAVERAISSLYDQNASIRGLVLYRQSRYVRKYADAGALLDAALKEALDNARGRPDLSADLGRLAQAARAWQGEVGQRVVALAGSEADLPQAMALSSSDHASALVTAFRAAAARARQDAGAWSASAEARQDAAAAHAQHVLAGGLLAVLAIMIAAAVWLTRAIAGPVNHMTGVMKRLAEGDNGVDVPSKERRDEVGRMARAVQVFKDAAVEKLRLEAAAAEQRRQAEAERARNEAARASAAERQAAVVSALARGLADLSAGDLLARLNDPFAEDYESLRRDFNQAMETLQGAMQVVSSTASAISSGTGEIASAADDLSRRTEHQAASLEETAAALDQITATVKKTAQGAAQAQAIVALATRDAEQSGAVVRDAVEAMAEIERSSRQIGQILGVIDEIAFQTNLLALNAGVEAARAGDAGRGFAVVASEVRALAQRSAEAAREIKTLISTSSARVTQGVEMVDAAGKSLERITAQVAQINAVIGGIAASAGEQASGLDQVNTAVNQMDQVTQQNAAMVEQSTAAAHALRRETAELAALIARFRVDDVPAPTAAAPPRLRPAAIQLRTTSARKPKSVASPDGWEAF